MSTVVVVKKNGKAVIAADTMSSFGDTKVTKTYLANRDKIIRFGDTFLGVTGSTAHNNVLQNLFRRYKKEISFRNETEIFATYLRMHSILKDEYFINPKEEDSDPYESSQIDALLCNPQGIFGMYSWRDVFEFERFWALGSGMEYALGAMRAVYERLETAEEIAVAALESACEFDNGSSLPFTMYAVELGGKKKP